MPGRYRFPINAGTRTVRTINTPNHNTLPKTFDCLFCSSSQSVRVTLDRKNKVGRLRCGKCAVTFECAILHIECEVDVHAKWIDACEEVEKDREQGKKRKREEEDEVVEMMEEKKGKKRKLSSEDEEVIRNAGKRYRVA